jgi:hypothetical protein
MNTVQALTDLAQEPKIWNPARLLAAARGKMPQATLELAKAALKYKPSRQVVASKYRSTGKSAAEGPNERLQADLLGFSQNTRTTQKYALVVNGIYTREVRAQALSNKNPATVNRAAQKLIPALVEDEHSFSISTDSSREFSKLDQAIPAQAEHREEQSVKDMSVLDRAMQRIKREMAGDIANGTKANWVQALSLTVEAHGSRPCSTTYIAPKKVEEAPAADFRILEDNARKFTYNRNAQQRKNKSSREAGAFRAPTANSKSFELQYKDVQIVGDKNKGDPPNLARNTAKGQHLLKETQPVLCGSVTAAGRLTDKNLSRKLRLQERAKDLEAFISDIGGANCIT